MALTRSRAGYLYLNVQHTATWTRTRSHTHTHTLHAHIYWVVLYAAVIFCLSRAVRYPAERRASLSVALSLVGLMRADDQ